MADIDMAYACAPDVGSALDPLRMQAIRVYVLILLTLPSLFGTLLLGAAIAAVKSGPSEGTIFASHFANAIDIFWVTLVVGTVGLFMWPLYYLGALIHAGLFVWVMFRALTGLRDAIEGRPVT